MVLQGYIIYVENGLERSLHIGFTVLKWKRTQDMVYKARENPKTPGTE